METIDWSAVGQFIERVGLPGAALFLIGLATWKSLRYVGKQLFETEKGLLPRGFARLDTHLTRQEACSETLTTTLKSHADEARAHARDTADGLANIKRVGLDFADALERIATTLNADIAGPLAAIRAALTTK